MAKEKALSLVKRQHESYDWQQTQWQGHPVAWVEAEDDGEET